MIRASTAFYLSIALYTARRLLAKLSVSRESHPFRGTGGVLIAMPYKTKIIVPLAEFIGYDFDAQVVVSEDVSNMLDRCMVQIHAGSDLPALSRELHRKIVDMDEYTPEVYSTRRGFKLNAPFMKHGVKARQPHSAKFYETYTNPYE